MSRPTSQEHERVSLLSVQPVLMCRDVSAAVRFYATLGFTLQFQDDPADPKYAVILRDQVELHLQWQDASQWAHLIDRPTYRFRVHDVEGLYAEFRASECLDDLTSAGSPWGAPGDTPWGTREFHVRDRDGNGLQFYRMQ